MANFKVHLNVAAVASVAGATGLFVVGNIDIRTTVWLAFLGTIGGLAPDIDSGHSTSSKVVFLVLAFFCAATCGYLLSKSSLPIMVIVNMLAMFLVVQFVIKNLFDKFSVHRGCCHSIAFAVLIGIAMANAVSLLGLSDDIAWLSGLFLFGGCIVHLVLDEMYSIDVKGKRFKSSLGTAMKLISFRNPVISTAQIAIIIALFYIAPHFTLTHHHLFF